MSSSFGYFNKIGYKGHLFPIVIGESGSRYTDVRRGCCSLACFPSWLRQCHAACIHSMYCPKQLKGLPCATRAFSPVVWILHRRWCRALHHEEATGHATCHH